MPMQLLQDLATQAFPVSVHGEDVEKVVVLMDAHLITAELPPPEKLPSGLPLYRATVRSLTPAGSRVANALAVPQL